MIQIKLSAADAKVIRESDEAVSFLDEAGCCVGYLRLPNNTSFSAADIAEAERRADSGGPWYTTAEVLSHLRALEQGR